MHILFLAASTLVWAIIWAYVNPWLNRGRYKFMAKSAIVCVGAAFIPSRASLLIPVWVYVVALVLVMAYSSYRCLSYLQYLDTGSVPKYRVLAEIVSGDMAIAHALALLVAVFVQLLHYQQLML